MTIITADTLDRKHDLIAMALQEKLPRFSQVNDRYRSGHLLV